jgi:hypothetical protein
MKDMRRDTPVTSISEASSPRARAQRRMRDLATAAARTAATTFPEEPPRGGRAWLNGSELGGYDRRYAHLTRAYE